jgi:peptide-methionine (S)-S-oxide reductase
MLTYKAAEWQPCESIKSTFSMVKHGPLQMVLTDNEINHDRRDPVKRFRYLMMALMLGLGGSVQSAPGADGLETATFAGGCFWCVEQAFDEVEGVVETLSGYIGGHKMDPTYKQVSAGGTGHAEAVQLRYDPTKVSYGQLLDVFWRNIDPVTPNAQFCDQGSQYRSAIFYHGGEQQRLAEKSLKVLEQAKTLPGPIVTEIVPATQFYVAEGYHQDYHHTNPLRYKFYKYNCGRAQRLETLWGKAEAR